MCGCVCVSSACVCVCGCVYARCVNYQVSFVLKVNVDVLVIKLRLMCSPFECVCVMLAGSGWLYV